MARDDSKSRVKITSNFNSFMAGFENQIKGFQGRGIRARLWNDVEYAIYVEFGTAHMLPRAMVRNSIPAIEQKFEQEMKALPAGFTEQNLKDLVQRVIDFALEEVKRRTPVDSGDLQAGWNTDPVEPI